MSTSLPNTVPGIWAVLVNEADMTSADRRGQSRGRDSAGRLKESETSNDSKKYLVICWGNERVLWDLIA